MKLKVLLKKTIIEILEHDDIIIFDELEMKSINGWSSLKFE